MKKSLILGSAALTLTLSLGAVAPTFATNNSTTTITNIAPTRDEINRAIAEAKGLNQYYEYANLFQAVQSASSYSLQTALLTIDSSIVTTNLSTTELIKIATSLPRYQAYKYVNNLITYTENWLINNYYSASNADKQEALDAINDAVISCRLMFKNQPSQKSLTTTPATVTTQSTATALTAQAPTTAAKPTETPVTNTAVETVATVATTTTAPVSAEVSNDTTAPVSQTTSVASVASDNHNDGMQISVVVHNDQSEVVNLDETATNTEDAAEDNTEDTSIATGCTYAATTFSLAGAALATKRETSRNNYRRKSRRLHRI